MADYILKSYRLNFSPLEIFEVFSKEKNCFFLDSSLNVGSLGRYSFLGIDPALILKTKGEDPFKRIREELEVYNAAFADPSIGFLGGAVGYLAYDLGFVFEKKIKKKFKPDLGIPDSFFGFYNSCVIIDHCKQIFYILSLGYPEKSAHSAKTLARDNFKKIYNLLAKINSSGNRGKNNGVEKTGKISSNFTKTEYLNAIRRAKEYIKKGDIYQVNLSQMFSAKTGLSAFQIYKRLRSVSSSCFSAFFDAGDFQIISSSPERFLKFDGEVVSTRPMKGTRPRSESRLKDAAFKRDLLESAKDKAELMMIVDLERNDLGRVCSYDTVKVPVLRELEEYQTVFQTTASIEGRLHKNKDRLDLLRACFPGGSIIGCPKIRAMEIIEELEPDRRSIYTGCLGYLSFSGAMDFNILIRSILKKEDQLYFSSGGGIVADSDPQEEYQETLVKTKGILRAINASSGS